MPARLSSLSACLCDFVPDLWTIGWTNMAEDARVAAAARWGIAADVLPALLRWTDAHFASGRVGWPNVVFDLDTARTFARDHLPQVPDLLLLGIGLHPDFVSDFLAGTAPAAGEGTPGIRAAVEQRQLLPDGGLRQGWEVLCYDHGGFHSWLCNHLQTDVARRFGITPGANGLLAGAGEAVTAARYCGSPEVGAEPGFWGPWLVVRYPL